MGCTLPGSEGFYLSLFSRKVNGEMDHGQEGASKPRADSTHATTQRQSSFNEPQPPSRPARSPRGIVPPPESKTRFDTVRRPRAECEQPPLAERGQGGVRGQWLPGTILFGFRSSLGDRFQGCGTEADLRDTLKPRREGQSFSIAPKCVDSDCSSVFPCGGLSIHPLTICWA